MDAEIRQRIDHTLDTTKPDDTLVLAAMGSNGAVIHTIRPDAAKLVDLASSLLDQALDALRRDGADETDLADQIEGALGLLPDRHAAPGEAGDQPRTYTLRRRAIPAAPDAVVQVAG